MFIFDFLNTWCIKIYLITDWFCKIPFINEFLFIWISLCYLFCCFFIKQGWWKQIWIANLQQLIFKTIKILIFLNIYCVAIFQLNFINYYINLPKKIENLTFGLYFNGDLVHNYFTIYMKTLLLILIYNSIKQWIKYININNFFWNSIVEFPFLFLGSSFFLLILFSINNFFLGLYSIIGMSICFYVLLAINTKFGSLPTEACIKYFIMSALSTGLIFGGLKEIFLASGSANFNTINDFCILLITNTSFISQFFVIKYGMIFVFSGFLFKLSAAPNHFWAPEVYEGLPYALLNFIVLPVKFAIAFIFLRIFKIVFTLFAFNEFDNFLINNEIEILVIITTVFSMLIGGVNALFEQKLKRFIAYSSINQIGFLFVGLLGLNSSIQGIQSFIYFFLVYIINLTVFLNLIIFYTEYNYFWIVDEKINGEKSIFNLIYLTDFKNIFNAEFFQVIKKNFNNTEVTYLAKKKNMHIFIFLFIAVLFSLAGIPPLLGFFGKFYILLYAFKIKYFCIVIFGVLISILSVYYYLRFLKIIFFEDIIQNQTKIYAYKKTVQTKTERNYNKLLIILFLLSPIFLDNFFLTQTFELTQSLILFLN